MNVVCGLTKCVCFVDLKGKTLRPHDSTIPLGCAYLWSTAVATDREAMALTASASSESARLASSRDSSSLGE